MRSAGLAAIRRTVALAILFFIVRPIWGDDFQGATGLLKKLNDTQTPVAPAAASHGSSRDTAAQFAEDLAAFSKGPEALAPDEEARQWLDLFERGLKLQAARGQLAAYSSAGRAAFSALPRPASWPDLQKLVEAGAPDNPAYLVAWPALRLIVHTLNGEEDKQWADLSGLATAQLGASAAMFRNAEGESDAFLALGSALSDVAFQPGQVEKFWQAALTRRENLTTAGSTPDAGVAEVELPDLVTLLGDAKAGPLILRTLLLPNERVGKVNGLATQKAARQLALSHIDQIHVAPWSLTASLDGATLYEALRKKFSNDADGKAYAIYYVIALVTQGRSDEAAKVDIDIDTEKLADATAQAANAGWGPQVYDFVHAYLGLHPESDLWEFYITLAAQTGHAADALKFMQDTDARPDLSAAAHERIRPVLYRALLAVDRVDEGVEQLRELIKAGKAGLASAGAAADPTTITSAFMRISQRIVGGSSGNLNPTLKLVQWDLELAKLGHLLKRADLETEGLDDAVRLAEIPPPASGSDIYGPSNAFNLVVDYEIVTGRYLQGEKLLIDRIAQDNRAGSQPAGSAANYGDYRTRQDLMKLALLYYEAGRWPDIIALLQNVPGWGEKDLAQIATEGSYLARRSTPHLDLMAARALAETGRMDEATPILDYALQEDSGNDAAYALLLKIHRGDVIAKLDAFYRQDQFQERPLIWKAVALLKQGKVAEAEEACKAAIAVDPSDGEEGKGDRMRVYSVMADVCDAKKDPQQATFFRNVVKAIRLSEDADDYFDAGLLTRAVAMYAQALGLFSDAYCIQSRIARQLADLGRLDEAAVHYRKAFELMPVSFGRLESHCFGCERAFKGKTAVAIAEATFTEMMAKDPSKPQIPYLLGYLYMEEDRYPEAVANFEKAARLDPDYINAWRHIAEIGENDPLNPTLRDDAVFNVLRLDPAGRHVTPNTQHVRQLDKLWQAEEVAQKAVPPLPGKLLPLTASAAQLQASDDTSGLSGLRIRGLSGLDADARAWMELQQLGFRLGRFGYRGKGEGFEPRNAVLENKVISGALDYL